MNADERARKEAEPMYSCRNEHCAAEVSYPANRLRIHPDDTLVCRGCWEDGENEGDERGWTELPVFVSHKQALTDAHSKGRAQGLREAAELVRTHTATKPGHLAKPQAVKATAPSITRAVLADAIEALIDNPDSEGSDG